MMFFEMKKKGKQRGREGGNQKKEKKKKKRERNIFRKSLYTFLKANFFRLYTQHNIEEGNPTTLP